MTDPFKDWPPRALVLELPLDHKGDLTLILLRGEIVSLRKAGHLYDLIRKGGGFTRRYAGVCSGTVTISSS